jgi:hypothetical protein
MKAQQARSGIHRPDSWHRKKARKGASNGASAPRYVRHVVGWTDHCSASPGSVSLGPATGVAVRAAATEQHSPDVSPGSGSRGRTAARYEAAKPLSTAQVKQQIQEKLRTEPELGNAPIHAKVNGGSVVLKGYVDSARQHDLALRIAQSYAGSRQIVDHIKTRPSP